MRIKANDLHNFEFKFVGSGHYMVTYQTDIRGDYWSCLVTDMAMIDLTKNAEYAKSIDINRLRSYVCRNGSHYSYGGKRLN